MRLKIHVAAAILVFACYPTAQTKAQGRQELAFSAGAGSLFVNGAGRTSPVGSFSYRFHFTNHISAEGALDFFSYEFQSGPPAQPYSYRDGYSGAEAALVYYLRQSRPSQHWLPFIAAGVGKTTTDFTEIAAAPYYRIGVGISYHFTARFGIRVEMRDEIITKLYGNGSPNGNLPSIRFGLVYRF